MVAPPVPSVRIVPAARAPAPHRRALLLGGSATAAGALLLLLVLPAERPAAAAHHTAGVAVQRPGRPPRPLPAPPRAAAPPHGPAPAPRSSAGAPAVRRGGAPPRPAPARGVPTVVRGSTALLFALLLPAVAAGLLVLLRWWGHCVAKSALSQQSMQFQWAACASGGEGARGPEPAPHGVDINGKAPELKAAEALTNMFTFVACRTIMLEIEGYDNEGGSALQHPVWRGLQDALASRRMDEHFIEELLRDPHPDMRMAALRILEVRKAFAAESFNWAQVRTEALRLLDEGGEKALRQHVERGVLVGEAPVRDVDH